LIEISPDVGHAREVVGDQLATLVYRTRRAYGPDDEGRLPYDPPFFNYGRELQRE